MTAIPMCPHDLFTNLAPVPQSISEYRCPACYCRFTVPERPTRQQGKRVVHYGPYPTPVLAKESAFCRLTADERSPAPPGASRTSPTEARCP